MDLLRCAVLKLTRVRTRQLVHCAPARMVSACRRSPGAPDSLPSHGAFVFVQRLGNESQPA